MTIKKTKNSALVALGAIAILMLGYFLFRESPRDEITNPATDQETKETVPPTSSPTSEGDASAIKKPTNVISSAKQEPAASPIPKGYITYTSGQHNFALSYPKGLTLANSFSPFHSLATTWRSNTPLAIQGSPLIEIPLGSYDNSAKVSALDAYFFTSVVRVGISPNTLSCYSLENMPSAVETSKVSLSGTQWTKYTYTAVVAGDEKARIANYRTLRGSFCYSIELISHGTIDKARNPELQTTIAKLEASTDTIGRSIVSTFRFLK